MKISSISSYTNYYNNNNIKKVSNNNENKKFDSIKINKSNNSNSSNQIEKEASFDISKLKQKLTDEATESLSQEKIEEIRKQIKDKTYDVDAEELAKIILDI